MTIQVLKIVTHAVQLATVLFCGWYVFAKRPARVYGIFAITWMLILLYDLIMVVIGLINPVNNHWAYNLAFPIIQLFTAWFFIVMLRQMLLVLLMVLFAGFVCYNLIAGQGAVTLNTYSIALGGILILSLASVKLYLLSKEETPRSIFTDPAFWMCAGFILYWGLATPFFAMYNFLWLTYPVFFTFYFFTVSFGFTIILNICIIKALQCSLNTTRR